MKNLLLLLLTSVFISISVHAQKTVKDFVSKGIELFDKGDYDGALKQYQDALALDNNSTTANYEMANTCLHLKRYEEAGRYVNKTIELGKKAGDKDIVILAYMTKGNLLDLTGKPDDALATYLSALKDDPDNYLLHYNPPVTYFGKKQYHDAEAHAIRAIKANRRHSSSHLVLAQCMYFQGHRVQSLLCLYNFLLLENDTKRAAAAFTLLTQELKQGVSQEGEKINITVPARDTTDEFGTADMVISMSEALKHDEKNTAKTEEELLYDQTKTLFSMLDELKEKKKPTNIWWDTYVPFFASLNKAGNTEAFIYYIGIASKNTHFETWKAKNQTKFDKFSAWANANL